MRLFRFENGAFHECQFLDGDMMPRQEGGQLIVYVKARQRIGFTAGQLSGHLWSSPKNVGGLRPVGVGMILMTLMILMMMMTLITMTMVMVGSSMAIFGLLLRMWVVAGLCGGGALGRAWAKQGVRSCLSSLECFVGSHLDRSQKNSDLSHQIFLAHITLPASLLSGLIALGAGVMRMMRMMVIKD